MTTAGHVTQQPIAVLVKNNGESTELSESMQPCPTCNRNALTTIKSNQIKSNDDDGDYDDHTLCLRKKFPPLNCL